MSFKKICEQCERPFESRRSEQRFCSPTCAYKGREAHKKRVEFKCATCGKSLERCPSQLTYKKHYCSKKCHSEATRKRNKGRNNPNWKGGIEAHKISARRGPGHHLYRKGRYYELKARKELESQGFAVTRAAASKGPWDLIAIRSDAIKLVQVKANNMPRPAERKILIEFECPPIVIKEIWRYIGQGKLLVYEIVNDRWALKGGAL